MAEQASTPSEAREIVNISRPTKWIIKLDNE
jgi:hypothetical protein